MNQATGNEAMLKLQINHTTTKLAWNTGHKLKPGIHRMNKLKAKDTQLNTLKVQAAAGTCRQTFGESIEVVSKSTQYALYKSSG